MGSKTVTEEDVRNGVSFWNASSSLGSVLVFNNSYEWFVETSNGHNATRSETRSFVVGRESCASYACHNGGVCVVGGTGDAECLCPDGFVGARCDQRAPVMTSSEGGMSAGAWAGVAIAVVVVVAGVVALGVVLVLRSQRNKTDKDQAVQMEVCGLVQQQRFDTIDVPASLMNTVMAQNVGEQLRRDASENGFALSLELLCRRREQGKTRFSKDVVEKALLYAHNQENATVELMKALIRQHHMATTADMLLPFSKMMGLPYLHATLALPMLQVVQHIAKNGIVFDQLDDEGKARVVQYCAGIFLQAIYASVEKIPSELCEVMAEAEAEEARSKADSIMSLRMYSAALLDPTHFCLLDEQQTTPVQCLVSITNIFAQLVGECVGSGPDMAAVAAQRDNVRAFYQRIQARGKAREESRSPFVPTPEAIYASSLAVIATDITENAQDKEERAAKARAKKRQQRTKKRDRKRTGKRAPQMMLPPPHPPSPPSM